MTSSYIDPSSLLTGQLPAKACGNYQKTLTLTLFAGM